MSTTVSTNDYLLDDIPARLQGYRASYPPDYPVKELQDYTLDALRERLNAYEFFGSDPAPFGFLTFENYNDREAPWQVCLVMSDDTKLPGYLVIPGHVGLVLESAFDDRNRRQLCLPFHYNLFKLRSPSALSKEEQIRYVSRVRLFLNNVRPANETEDRLYDATQ